MVRGAEHSWHVPFLATAEGLLAHSRFNIVERSIGRGQKSAVTAALAEFAPVFDTDGTLLAAPERPREPPAGGSPPRRPAIAGAFNSIFRR